MIEELKFLGKFTKKKNFGGGGRFGGVGSGWRGGGGVKVDVNEELNFLWGGGGRVGGGGQVGCDRRIEVLGKIDQKKSGGGGGG